MLQYLVLSAMKMSRKKALNIFIYIGVGVLAVVITGVAVFLFWPGPDTIVVNDTNHDIELTDCGDAGAQIPPGDVESLPAGGQVTIPSGKFERANVCDVYFSGTKQNSSTPLPDACLPLPLKDSETISVSQRLKSYPVHDHQPCDLLMKSY